MEIKTKYDVGQRVFFVDTINLRVLPVEVISIRIDAFKPLGVAVCTTLYFLSIHTWVHEDCLYLTREEAQWQIDGRLQSPAMPIDYGANRTD
jgi:hypothetical protein